MELFHNRSILGSPKNLHNVHKGPIFLPFSNIKNILWFHGCSSWIYRCQIKNLYFFRVYLWFFLLSEEEPLEVKSCLWSRKLNQCLEIIQVQFRVYEQLCHRSADFQKCNNAA